MKIHIETTVSEPIKEFKEDIPRRLLNVQRVIGRDLANRTAQEVKRRIPARGGWYTIYRDAIVFREHENGTEWAVAGLAEIKLSDPPADTTLVSFSGTGTFSAILSAYNPWPIDLIPPVLGGYDDTVVARSVPSTSVEAERERISPLLDIIRQALEDAGANVGSDADLPVIRGKVYADLAYLARRLELGYTGFPHVPHWGPASSKLETNGESWGSSPEIIEAAENALQGGDLPFVSVMSRAEAEKLAQVRASTWP